MVAFTWLVMVAFTWLVMVAFTWLAKAGIGCLTFRAARRRRYPVL